MTQLTEAQQKAWEGFVGGDWQHEVNVRDFIQKNYTPYEGDDSYLMYTHRIFFVAVNPVC